MAAVKKPRASRAKKAAVASEPAEAEVVEAEPVPPTGPGFDVIGEDGRRVVRHYAFSAARDFADRLSNETGEKLEIVESA